MIGRIGILTTSACRRSRVRAPRRTLCTDHIYPHPKQYLDEIHFKPQAVYRENFYVRPRHLQDIKIGKMVMTFFWAWFSFQLYDDPGVILGHFHPPNPALWTDEELGVPPLEEGSYIEWLEKRRGK